MAATRYDLWSGIHRVAVRLLRRLFSAQRGNVSLTNLQLINALFYVVEHGCKWRGLLKHIGNWHTIYTRTNCWSKSGSWTMSSRGCRPSKSWSSASSA
jgi:transposase